jgi:uncharacterized membrane protein (UPF0127 family)
MSAQALLCIGDKRWQVAVATSYEELCRGLGGLPELPSGTGMLFDLGYPQIIRVTTEPMLFSLDIAFLSQELVVTEVYRDIEPGYVVTSEMPARYFLEVNAGELEQLRTGDQASLEYLSPETTVASLDWGSAGALLLGATTLGLVTAGLVNDFASRMLGKQDVAAIRSPQPHWEAHEVLQEHRRGQVPCVTPPARKTAEWFKEQGAQFVAYSEDRLGLLNLVVGGIQGEAMSATVWRKDQQSSWSGLALLRDRILPLSDENLETLVDWVKSEVPGNYHWQRYEIPLVHSVRLGWHPTISRDEVSRPILLPRNIEDAGRTRACIEEIALWYVANRREMRPVELERIVLTHFTAEGEVRRFVRYLSSRQGQEEFRMALSKARRAALTPQEQPAVVVSRPRPAGGSGLEYLADSPEFLAYTIEDIGYREKLDAAFLEAIRRAKGH